MKRNILIRFSVVIGTLALACSASGALSVDEQVKMLAARYRKVEDQLARSIRYTTKDESGGATKVRQEWYNGAEDLIKAAVERNDASGRELTEYIPHDLGSDFGWRGLFLLTRKETPLPDGGTQVEESRKYFGETEEGNDQLIRELRKSARFKPSEPTDTVHVPNVVVDLSKQNKGEGGAEEFGLGEPHELSPALRKVGPPQFFDPFANVKGDSDRFRVIHGSASPDSRYAIALGLNRKEIDWATYADAEGTYYFVDWREKDLCNYVVDLGTRRILGKTGCKYNSTRSSLGHDQCIVAWSPDCSTFIQLANGKWSYRACYAGRIAPGPKLVGTVNLGKEADKSALAFLGAHEGGTFRRKDRHISSSMSLGEVTNDGTIALELWGEDQSDAAGNFEKLTERLRLRSTPAGLRLETLNVRYAPTKAE